MPCEHQIPHLNELQAKFGGRGLVVVGVTGGEAAKVDAYVESHEMRYPVAIGYSGNYDVTGIPHAFLIDKEGKIVWRGHPASLAERQIVELLPGAKPPFVQAGLEDVYTLRFGEQFGEAYRLADKLLAQGGLSPAATEQAKAWNAEVVKFVADAMAEADAVEQEKDVYLLWSKLDPVARLYKGVPGGEQAAARLEALMANKVNQQEVEAGVSFAEAQRLEQQKDFTAAMEIYENLGKRFGRTKAGKNAKIRHRDMLKAGLLGYRGDCNYCRAGEKACPTHARKK